jgi:predicted aspartyl protease
MAIWVYPFHKISDEIFRPWIPVQIINPANNQLITVLALLDTGADFCVFPKFVADQTNIDLKGAALSSETMQGLAESRIEVWKHSFRINLLSPDRKNVVWKSKELIVGCVEHDNIPPILGFSNFMCNFKIAFNHATKKILVDDHPNI